MASRNNWFDEVGAKDSHATQGDCKELEFTHGIEVEYFLVDEEGKKLSHADFGKVYSSILSEKLIYTLEESIPKFYGEKVSSLKIGPSRSSTYEALYVNYRARGNLVKAELISVDRNVVEWPLLELATPPCESLYELGWWSSAVLALVNAHLYRMGNRYQIMAFGVNPYEKVEDITQSESFPTCGEHHHIKLIEQKTLGVDERAFFTNFYHLLRFFTPYLILLSACSPFASGRLWGRYRPNDLGLPFPRCVRSLRVLYNKKHLCNFQDGEYMPYLEMGWLDRNYFIQEFKRQSNSFRNDTHFLDMDPYSKENRTFEIRFFDTQPSMARRIGLAILIQLLAKKAKKIMAKDEENILGIMRETNGNLQALKKMACEGGNWFKPSINSIFGKSNITGKLKHSGIEKNILSDLVLEMLYFIRAEINESDLIYSRFLDPIRYSIYGLNGNGISPAQHWLFIYINQGQDMKKVVNKILEASLKSTNMWYDPVVNEPVTLSYLTDAEVQR